MCKEHVENARSDHSLTLNVDSKPKAEPSLWVRQSNKLALAYYTLTIQEMRLIWDLAARTRLTDNDFMECEFRLSELHTIFGVHTTFAEAEAMLLRLYRRELHVESVLGVREALRWVISAERDEGREIFRIALHPKLKTYFLGLKEYVMSEKVNLCAFSSEYAARLYMMACVYRNQNVRTWEISIAELRARLGIRSDQYQRFSNLRARVLDAPIKEINKKAAPFELDFTVDKRGPTPTNIFFELKNWTRTTTGTGAKVAAQIADRRKKMKRKKLVQGATVASATIDEGPAMLTDQERATHDKFLADLRKKQTISQEIATAHTKREKAQYVEPTAKDLARAKERSAALAKQMELIERNSADLP